MAEQDRKIRATGPSESAMRPGTPDDPRSYPRHEWGAPGLPPTPGGDEEALEKRGAELVKEGNASDTSAMKEMLKEETP